MWIKDAELKNKRMVLFKMWNKDRLWEKKIMIDKYLLLHN